MGRLFLQHTYLADFEIMMQKIPRYIKHESMPENITYLEMLYITINDYKIKGLYKKIKKLIGGGDEDVMLFISNDHKLRFMNFYKHALKMGWEVIDKNKNLAALYLLSASDHLWKQMKNIVDEDGIHLENINIQSKGVDVYDVYQAIRFILYGAEKLTLDDLAEPEIVSDDVVLLITNSFIINKYGIAPLQVKHLKKVKVKQSVGKD